MTAATGFVDTPESALMPAGGAVAMCFLVAAATTIYAGTMVATDASGYAVPASATSAVKVWGRAEKTVVNQVAAGYGAAGALSIDVKPGVFALNNGDAITAADVGKPCFAGDDNTVFLNPATATVAKCYAGIIHGLDGSKVKVGMGPLFGSPFTSAASAVGALPAFAAGAMAPAATALVHDGVYEVPTTAANSTITLPAAAPVGTVVTFVADGTKNGHTVQYVDATGTVNLTTALTASKRHQVRAVKLSATVWTANAYVSP